MCAASERDREKVRGGGGDYYEAVELSSSVKGLQNILMSRVETAAEKSFRSSPLSRSFLSPSLSSFFFNLSLSLSVFLSPSLSLSLSISHFLSHKISVFCLYVR